MRYVDGFVIPIPRRRLARYQRLARRAGKVWKDLGAIEYIEAVGDDLRPKGVVATFPKTVRARPGETVLFSFIVFRSRAHRDRVNAKVMKDPRMLRMMAADEEMPFDLRRMLYGGFRTLVDL